MAAAGNERGSQKICFFDWLVNEINSGKHEGLYWLDENHTLFRIPWKHNSRKDLVPSDYMIFKEWAIFSGKHVETVQDPARWKTNFRCALNSTRRFEEVKSNGLDYHVYRIIAAQPNNAPAANLPANTNNSSNPEVNELHAKPCSGGAPGWHQPTPLVQQEIDVAFGTLTLEQNAQVPTGNTPGNVNCDTLWWVLQQTQMNLGEIQTISWAPVQSNHLPLDETPYEQNGACVVPEMDQPLKNQRANEPVRNNCYEEPLSWLVQNAVNSQSPATVPLQQAQQTPLDINQCNHVEALGNNNCFVENVFMDEEPEGDAVIQNNATRNDCHLGTGQQPMMEEGIYAQPGVPSVEPRVNVTPLQNNIGAFPLQLDVSIHYRGRPVCELVVEESSCVFTYKQCYADVAPNTQIIRFPETEELPDKKQAKSTLKVLQDTDLLLYQKNEKLCARRLGKSRVFWAFSKQLNNMAEPRMLPREENIEIFNYEKFHQELRTFMNGQIHSFPDYTIYLCFGQRLSASKPKESKLILVKLVSRICKYWHEQSQREGASSLNIENDSLQISNSLYDMVEQLSTMFYAANGGTLKVPFLPVD